MLRSYGELEVWEWLEEGVCKIELTGKGILEDWRESSLSGSYVGEDHYRIVIREDSDVYLPPTGDVLSLFEGEESREDRLLLSLRKRVYPKVKFFTLGNLFVPFTERSEEIEDYLRLGILGYLEASLRVPCCRPSKGTRDKKYLLPKILPHLKDFQDHFEKVLPEYSQRLAQVVTRGNFSQWVLGETLFSTIRIFRDLRIPVERKPPGWGMFLSIGGDSIGGYLGCPKYKISVDLGEGDILVRNLKCSWGTTEKTPNLEGETRGYDRLYVSLDTRLDLKECGTKETESRKFDLWKSRFRNSDEKQNYSLRVLQRKTQIEEEELEILKEMFSED